MWYPCENPFESLFCCCCWAGRGCARECCCALGASASATERLKVQTARVVSSGQAAVAEQEQGCRCCAVPIGRTAHFFDLDIVADVRAKQSCWQLLLVRTVAEFVHHPACTLIASDDCPIVAQNEGSLHFGRLTGGDASHNQRTATFFNVRYVPEVFSYFDELSYELSRMNLAHFRQNAMRNDMHTTVSSTARDQDI